MDDGPDAAIKNVSRRSPALLTQVNSSSLGRSY